MLQTQVQEQIFLDVMRIKEIWISCVVMQYTVVLNVKMFMNQKIKTANYKSFITFSIQEGCSLICQQNEPTVSYKLFLINKIRLKSVSLFQGVYVYIIVYKSVFVCYLMCSVDVE